MSRCRRSSVAAALSLALALASLTLGFGAVDLLSPWILHEGTQVSDVGYGALAGLILPAALLAQLGAAPWRRAGRQMIAAAATACLVAGIVGDQVPLLVAALAVGAGLGAVVAIDPLPRFTKVDRPCSALLALALIAWVPGSAYAVMLALEQRKGMLPADAHLGLGHWCALAAAVLATLLTALLAAFERRAPALPAGAACAAVLVWAAACLAYPASAGAPGRGWAMLALGWAIAFGAVTARTVSTRSRSSTRTTKERKRRTAIL